MLKKIKDRFNKAREKRRHGEELLKKISPQEKEALEKALAHEKGWFTWTRFFLASTALSTTLHFAPGLVSDKPKAYLEDRGLPTEMAEHFVTRDIRIAHRYNPLFPWAFAGEGARAVWIDGKENGDGFLSRGVSTVFSYPVLLLNGVLTMVTPTGLDAFSLSGGSDIRARSCMIRPPADISYPELVEEFSGIKQDSFKTASDQKQLSSIFQQYIIAHEMRHCDQNHRFNASSLNEADADLYALRVLAKTSGASEKEIKETKEILQHLRNLNAVRGDTHHTSAFTLARGGQTPLSAHEDTVSFIYLQNLVADGVSYTAPVFAKIDKDVEEKVEALEEKTGKSIDHKEMSDLEKRYHVTRAMQKAGFFQKNEGMAQAAQGFIAAVEYFDRSADGKVITVKNADQLLTGYLDIFKEPYVPVKDKLAETPAPKAASRKPLS